jgi:hypothetical protein
LLLLQQQQIPLLQTPRLHQQLTLMLKRTPYSFCPDCHQLRFLQSPPACWMALQ